MTYALYCQFLGHLFKEDDEIECGFTVRIVEVLNGRIVSWRLF
jgi:hypothetical protein